MDLLGTSDNALATKFTAISSSTTPNPAPISNNRSMVVPCLSTSPTTNPAPDSATKTYCETPNSIVTRWWNRRHTASSLHSVQTCCESLRLCGHWKPREQRMRPRKNICARSSTVGLRFPRQFRALFPLQRKQLALQRLLLLRMRQHMRYLIRKCLGRSRLPVPKGISPDSPCGSTGVRHCGSQPTLVLPVVFQALGCPDH